MLNKKTRKGFTMIELLIASLIMSIGVMGYTSSQMTTIFNIGYSYKVMHITNISSDFINIVLNESLTKETDEEKELLISNYQGSYWSASNYPSNLMNCEKSSDIDDPDVCGESRRIDYNVMKLKEAIEMEVPDATFSMFTCDSGVSCLSIAWQGSENTEYECKSNVNSCVLLEF